MNSTKEFIASKELPKAIIIKQAVSLIFRTGSSGKFKVKSIFKKKIYIEVTLKGIVRSLKPLECFLEDNWQLFYKLFLHMKYGQGKHHLSC